jgi:ABC-type multidrug transport system ATPase subunit
MGFQVLLLDEPFMGLDPPTLMTISPLLHRLAEANAPRLVLALRPQDPIPDWITHLVYLGADCQVVMQGKKDDVLQDLHKYVGQVEAGEIEQDNSMPVNSLHEVGRKLTAKGVFDLPIKTDFENPSKSTKDGKVDLEKLTQEERKLYVDAKVCYANGSSSW